MRRKNNFFVLSSVAALLLLFGGCMSLIDSIEQMDETVARTQASAGQAMSDAIGIGAMEDAMIAALMYSQAFFAGGYMQGYEDFSEGSGVVWEITPKEENRYDESESLEIERALLKRTEDGNSWWLLRYSNKEGEELLSESLLDENYEIVVFRYRDPETGSIREWKPEVEEDSKTAEPEEPEEMESAESAQYEGNYRDHIVGTETVTVPAGTYTAEHVRIIDSYTTENEDGTDSTYETRYEWWIDNEVPGDLVKYEWSNETEQSGIRGELIKLEQGYTTRLDSY